MKNMKNKVKVLVLAALFFAIGVQTAHSQRPCSGLTGQQRTSCLQAEVERTTAIANQANARLQSLNLAMSRACSAVALLNQTAAFAQRVGEVSSNKPLQYGGLTWTSVQTIMAELTRARSNCESAQLAVANARRSP